MLAGCICVRENRKGKGVLQISKFGNQMYDLGRGCEFDILTRWGVKVAEVPKRVTGPDINV